MPGDGSQGVVRAEEGFTDAQKKIFWRGDGYFHYFDCGDGFLGANIPQN